MAKFFGKIGYAVSKDVRPGVWDGEITEREYFGDLIRNTSRYQTSDKLNDDINISNEISIVADPFAYQNILGELKGMEGLLVASKIADRVGITRSVIVNALRKFESAGLIETKSLGMKGTYIRIKNEFLLEELRKNNS